MLTCNLTMGTLMLSRGNGLSSGGREKGRGMWKGGMVGGRERDVERGGWGEGGEGKKGGGDYFNFFQP